MDLSILIPARNEMFLKQTIDDILKNSEAKTEIIAVLDGNWPIEPIPQNERVNIVFLPKSIGQRAATNLACKLSKAKYVMKVDAHCSFDKGFDRKMLEAFKETGDNVVMVPIMRNLHAFDWVCTKCGFRRYQGPTEPCPKCGSEMKREIIWKGKDSPQSTSYYVNSNLEFGYFGEYKKKQKGDLVETMSLQGSCFMITREKYWDLNICDESWGSWGGQGAEVALKMWLSGGRVLVNKRTWYAHMFRTQGKDFGFPYPNPGKEQKKVKDQLRKTFLYDGWPKQKRPISWLVKKFNPPGWKKGIIFYTDNQLNLKIAHMVQKQLTNISKKFDIPIVSASLKPMLHFGQKNIVIKRPRGVLTMFKQILAALEACEADIIFFCEHDVLYHETHFDFIPDRKNIYYYNINVWKWRYPEKHFVKVNECKQTSGLCGYRDLLIEHYRKRVEYVEKYGYSTKIGYEPGTHNRKERIDDYKSDVWSSKYPNIDIRHNNNLTKNRWSPKEFVNKKYAAGWREATSVEGWNI